MIDRYEALALGVFALGVGIFVVVVVPRVEIAVAILDRALGGM
jgi:hypothetical protein